MEVAEIIFRGVQALAGLATVAVAIFAAIIARGTLNQKRESDERNRWWERMQWALDKYTSDNLTEQYMATEVFTALIKDRPRGDKRLAETIDVLVDKLDRQNTQEENTQEEKLAAKIKRKLANPLNAVKSREDKESGD